MKTDCTTNSHYITYTFSLLEVGRMHVLSLGVKGLNVRDPKVVLTYLFASQDDLSRSLVSLQSEKFELEKQVRIGRNNVRNITILSTSMEVFYPLLSLSIFLSVIKPLLSPLCIDVRRVKIRDWFWSTQGYPPFVATLFFWFLLSFFFCQLLQNNRDRGNHVEILNKQHHQTLTKLEERMYGNFCINLLYSK